MTANTTLYSKKWSLRTVQTDSLPVPSSATPANPESALKSVIVVEDPASGEEDPEEELRGKNLVQWLGMKDGISASMASQGSICFPRGGSVRDSSTSSSSSSSAAAAAVRSNEIGSDFGAIFK